MSTRLESIRINRISNCISDINIPEALEINMDNSIFTIPQRMKFLSDEDIDYTGYGYVLKFNDFATSIWLFHNKIKWHILLEIEHWRNKNIQLYLKEDNELKAYKLTDFIQLQKMNGMHKTDEGTMEEAILPDYENIDNFKIQLIDYEKNSKQIACLYIKLRTGINDEL